MRNPQIFERVYLRPVSITRPAFQALHQVLRPRFLGLKVEQEERPPKKIKSSTGRQDYPQPTTNADGRVIDDRLYSIVGPGVATMGIKGILARNVSELDAWCGMVGYEMITACARQLIAAPDILDVVLDGDGPGGECAGSQESREALDELAACKRVVGFSDGMAASNTYNLISAAPELFGTATSQWGSIGTRCAVLDDTKMLEDAGYKFEYFSVGEHKNIGCEGYALTDADRATLQAEIEYLYDLFAQNVFATRGLCKPLAEKSAEIYWGQQAVDAGLIDAIVTNFDEVVEMLVSTRP